MRVYLRHRNVNITVRYRLASSHPLACNESSTVGFYLYTRGARRLYHIFLSNRITRNSLSKYDFLWSKVLLKQTRKYQERQRFTCNSLLRNRIARSVLRWKWTPTIKSRRLQIHPVPCFPCILYKLLLCPEHQMKPSNWQNIVWFLKFLLSLLLPEFGKGT